MTFHPATCEFCGDIAQVPAHCVGRFRACPKPGCKKALRDWHAARNRGKSHAKKPRPCGTEDQKSWRVRFDPDKYPLTGLKLSVFDVRAMLKYAGFTNGTIIENNKRVLFVRENDNGLGLFTRGGQFRLL